MQLNDLCTHMPLLALQRNTQTRSPALTVLMSCCRFLEAVRELLDGAKQHIRTNCNHTAQKHTSVPRHSPALTMSMRGGRSVRIDRGRVAIITNSVA